MNQFRKKADEHYAKAADLVQDESQHTEAFDTHVPRAQVHATLALFFEVRSLIYQLALSGKGVVPASSLVGPKEQDE